MTETPMFVCPTCGRRSPHPKDISERFCSVCGFADDNLAEAEARKVAGRPRP